MHSITAAYASLAIKNSTNNEKNPVPISNTIGSLCNFPLEIRQRIWQQFIPTLAANEQPSFQILRVNKLIHSEVQKELALHQGEKVEFFISPRFSSSSWVTLKSGLSHRRKVRHIGQEDLPKLTSSLHQIIQHAKEIHINIEAPDTEDKGQLICLWQKIDKLESLLRSYKRAYPAFQWKHISITLHDTKTNRWFQANGEPTRSISEDPLISVHQTTEYFDDYAIAITPFCWLHNCISTKVNLPPNTNHLDHVLEYVETVESVMRNTKPSAHWPAQILENWNHNFQKMKTNVHEKFIQLDRALDNLTGPTADMLRLERMGNWYVRGTTSDENASLYEKKLFCAARRFNGVDAADLYIMDYRYRMMWALSPMPRNHDGWNPDLWRAAYPNGISLIDGFENRQLYIANHDQGIERCEVESLFDRLYAAMRKAQPEEMDFSEEMFRRWNIRRELLSSWFLNDDDCYERMGKEDRLLGLLTVEERVERFGVCAPGECAVDCENIECRSSK